MLCCSWKLVCWPLRHLAFAPSGLCVFFLWVMSFLSYCQQLLSYLLISLRLFVCPFWVRKAWYSSELPVKLWPYECRESEVWFSFLLSEFWGTYDLTHRHGAIADRETIVALFQQRYRLSFQISCFTSVVDLLFRIVDLHSTQTDFVSPFSAPGRRILPPVSVIGQWTLLQYPVPPFATFFVFFRGGNAETEFRCPYSGRKMGRGNWSLKMVLIFCGVRLNFWDKRFFWRSFYLWLWCYSEWS